MATRSTRALAPSVYNATPTTESYTLSLHDALPILPGRGPDDVVTRIVLHDAAVADGSSDSLRLGVSLAIRDGRDRKSTRLNSSHQINSYAVFCLKKKKGADV